MSIISSPLQITKVAMVCLGLLPLLTSAQDISWQSQGTKGVVAAAEKATVRAGLDMLAAGGNAADAAVAVILAETVTEHLRFSMGSEVTFMFYDVQSQKVKVLSGQGEAPLSQQAIDWYLKNSIPENDLKAAAVPAVIDVCVKALQLYGTQSFAQTVQPTLALLEAGTEPWHPDLARTLQRLVEAEQRQKGDRKRKLQAVADRFYRGDIADELAAWYQAKGAFLTKKDLASHVTEEEEPATITYKGYTVHKAGTWTQGPVMLQALRLLENFDLRQAGFLSPQYIHLVTEALKLSLADRDAYYGDPAFAKVPLPELLSDRYTRLRHPLIDPLKASNECRPGDPVNLRALRAGGGTYLPVQGGTVTCTVVDKWGNMVAATPSGWGSNAGAGSTGVVHGTRLRSFNTLPGHPNCIAPGKRPRVTISPTIVLRDGKPVLAMSVEGGDTQDQNSLTLFLAMLEFGLSPYQALTVPRFSTNLHQNSFNPSADRNQALPANRVLAIREGLSRETLESLRKMGHEVKLNEDKVNIGHPAIILIDSKTGTAYGGTDPSTPRFTGALK